MAELQKIATRESYGRELVALGAAHRDVVVLDADLSEATKTGMFKKAYPDRHFNMGIAEANLMGVAAGLAACGLVPFASTFAMFAAGRAYEQVRNSIGYPRLNVKIGATHGGISVGEDGASHQCIEDVALMRAIPGMTVIVPSDDVEARAVVQAVYAFEGPVYMRFGRLATAVFHEEGQYRFAIGKGEVLREGADCTILATGLMVYEALLAARQLAEEGINARVVNMATIKPLDLPLVLDCAAKTGRILTCEEHNVVGGLGEAVAAAVAEHCPVPVLRLGVEDRFGYSGPGARLLVEFGLCAENVAEKARQLMKL